MSKYENFKGRGMSADLGKSTKKGTQFVSIVFGIVDDEGKPKLDTSNKQITYEWQGYYTDATIERTIQALQFCGCTFPGDDVTNFKGYDTNIVDLQVEDTEYGKRVAWVNAPRTSSVNDTNRLGGGEKKALAAQFAGTLKLLKGGGLRAGVQKANAASIGSAKDPFAPEEPANDAQEPLAATGTDGPTVDETGTLSQGGKALF